MKSLIENVYARWGAKNQSLYRYQLATVYKRSVANRDASKVLYSTYSLKKNKLGIELFKLTEKLGSK